MKPTDPLRYGMRPTDPLRYGIIPDRLPDGTPVPDGRRPPHPRPPHPRPHPDCRPYCDQPIWYVYGDGDDDNGDGYMEGYRDGQAWSDGQQSTYFTPGYFVPFVDPRLDWAAEGGLGASPPAVTAPPPAARPGKATGPSQTDQSQYEQMMKAWR